MLEYIYKLVEINKPDECSSLKTALRECEIKYDDETCKRLMILYYRCMDKNKD